jgi:hypothetical protein
MCRRLPHWGRCRPHAAHLDFAGQTFEWVSAVDLGAVLRGEVHMGKNAGLGVDHQCRQLGHPWAQLIGHLASLLAGRIGIVLGEGGADAGADDAARRCAAMRFAGIGHGIAHEVYAAPLPGCAAQAAPGEAPQELD